MKYTLPIFSVTHPPSQIFRPVQVLTRRCSAVSPGAAVIRFHAVANKTYTVQYTDAPGLLPWTRMWDMPARTNDRVSACWTLFGPSHRFYHLVTPRAP